MHGRNLVLPLIFLAAAATVPAWGQASSGAQGAAVPDFSGIWVHPYFPGIEPAASGPGPVFNRSRRPDGMSNTSQFVGDYTNPILKPRAAEVVKQHGDISLAGGAYPTPSNQCWPSGVPYIFFQIGVQLLQQPNNITILYLRDHEVRRVRMKEPHPAQVTPSGTGIRSAITKAIRW